MSTPRIGFIGVGLMGHGMASNIITKGYPLTVMAHRNRAPVDDLISKGATEVTTPREMAQNTDIIHLCVSGSPQVEGCIRGPNGILAGAKPGLIVVDTSTSDPVSTKTLAEEMAAQGVTLVDAPLSRTPKEAAEGTLDTMVGCDPETLETIRPVLSTWAGIIVHMGPVGTGHTMKLINNFIAMGYATLYAEALAIGRKGGLTAAQIDSVIRPGRLSNGFYETFMKWTLERDENAHRFAISNAHKDMRYLSSMALDVGAVNPLQSVIKNGFAAMDAAGEGEKFVPMLADFVARQNGLDPED